MSTPGHDDERSKNDAEASGTAFPRRPTPEPRHDDIDTATGSPRKPIDSSAGFFGPARPAIQPERIGAYRIVREIGRGGMGHVYLAVRDDERFHNRVALKLIKREHDLDRYRNRFELERQILFSLNHPNIARCLDGGITDDGRPWFAMEYIEGLPVDDYCDRKKLHIDDRLRLFMKICSAVHHAHANLVIHRDLKPGNILVTSQGEPKLLDFGIAKLVNPDMGPILKDPTLLGESPMTPEYASPEQILGEPLSTASDVYSLGVLLYELLTGHRPYRLKSRLLKEVEDIICNVDPDKPSTAVAQRVEVEYIRTDRTTQETTKATKTLTPESVAATREGRPERLRRRLMGDIDNIVLKAMRKVPSARYPSAEALSEDIRRHLDDEPVTARPPSLWYRGSKFVHRNRLGVTAATLAAAALAATALAGVNWGRARSAELESLAQQRTLEDAVARDERLSNGIMSGLTVDILGSVNNALIDIPNAMQARKQLVNSVRRALSQVEADIPPGPALDRARARLLGASANLYNSRNLGKHEDAVAAATESVSLWRKVHDLPDVAADQHREDTKGLASALLVLSEIQTSSQVDKGQSAESLRNAQEAEELLDRLVRDQRDDMQSQLLHCHAQIELGKRWYRLSEDPAGQRFAPKDEADRAWRDATADLDRLRRNASSIQDEVDVQREIAIAKEQIAFFVEMQGCPQDALKWYGEVRNAWEEALKSLDNNAEPGKRTGYRRKIIQAVRWQASAARNAGDWDLSRQYADEHATLAQSLAEERSGEALADSLRADAAEVLGNAWHDQAWNARDEGRLDDMRSLAEQAIPYNTEFVEITAKAATRPGASTNERYRYAIALEKLGNVQMLTGNLAAAEASLREAQALQFEITQIDPYFVRARQAGPRINGSVAECYFDLGRLDEAKELAEDASDEWATLRHGADAETLFETSSAVQMYRLRARIDSQQGRPAVAAKLTQDAIALLPDSRATSCDPWVKIRQVLDDDLDTYSNPSAP